MNINFFRKIRVITYSMLLFIIVSTTPVIMLGIIQYKYLNNNVRSILENNNLTLVRNLEDKISLYVDMNSKAIEITSKVIYNAKPDFIKDILSEVLKDYDGFEYVYYVNDKNDVFLYDNDFHVTDVRNFKAAKGYLEQIKNNKNTFYIPLISEKIPQNKILGIITPVFSDNKLKGYIFGGLKFKKIQELCDFIMDDNAQVIIYDYMNKIFLLPESERYELIKLKNDVLESIKNRTGSFSNYVAADGEKVSVTFTFLSKPKWVIFLAHPLKQYISQARRNNLNFLIASLFSISLALIIGFVSAIYQHRFVNNFLFSIRTIATGNYSEKVKSKLAFVPREFDLLIDEFNLMAERIEKLDHFKSNLIDTVSHEFRTPLTSIKGFSATLLRKDVTFDKEMQRKLLKIISSQSDRLSRMIEDLLVVPKLEGHVLKLNLQEVELEPAIEDIVEFYPKNLIDIKVSGPIEVIADQDRLEQVILNILENAYKYSNPKGSVIKVRAFEEDEFVKVVISNSSEKVSEEKLNTLFNKFVRLDDTLTRTTGGTGLGLYITKGLVELMGGNIWIKSDSEFKVYFTLPIKKSARKWTNTQT